MSRIYLERHNPDKNVQRFYAMHVTKTIFGDWVLIRECGRIGSPGTIKENWFDTEEAKAVELKILQTKQKRGYIKVFPLCPGDLLSP